jgi:hypothetical protein
VDLKLELEIVCTDCGLKIRIRNCVHWLWISKLYLQFEEIVSNWHWLSKWELHIVGTASGRREAGRLLLHTEDGPEGCESQVLWQTTKQLDARWQCPSRCPPITWTRHFGDRLTFVTRAKDQFPQNIYKKYTRARKCNYPLFCFISFLTESTVDRQNKERV